MPRPATARRYAQALFELAAHDKKVDAWRQDLGVAVELAENDRVTRLLDSPAVPFAERRDVLTRLLGPHVAPQLLNLACLLASHGRFSIMPDVCRAYDDLVLKSRGIVPAVVVSAVSLSEAELEAVKSRVEQLAGSKVELSQQVDPALIGGVCVRIGDLQIDASVASRLRRLRQELVQGAS